MGGQAPGDRRDAAAAEGGRGARAATRSGQVAAQPLDGQPVYRGGVRQRPVVRVGELVRHVGHGHEIGASQGLRSSAAPSRMAGSSRSPTMIWTGTVVSSARATKSSSSAIAVAAGCQG